jgi:hypothetical protein
MIRPSSSMGMFFAPWTITTEKAKNEYTIRPLSSRGMFFHPLTITTDNHMAKK